MYFEDFPSPVQRKIQSRDRFIQSRKKVQQYLHALPEDNPLDNVDAIIDQKLYSSSEETYKYLVASTLSVTCIQKSWVPQWPVHQRANPQIGSPTVVLDLPNIRHDLCSSLMDWSATDYLTVGFSRSVYLWHAPSSRTLRYTANNPTCIKWNLDGTFLFSASRNGTFRMMDLNQQEDVVECMRNSCHLNCFITTSTFHPTMPILFMGCSKGAVSRYYFNKGLHIINSIQNTNTAVSLITLSCDGKHLAVSSVTGLVNIYDTTSLSAIKLTIKMLGPSRAMAWHPWNRYCLVVGDCTGFMALFSSLSHDIPPQATYTSRFNSGILGLSFNPISAELVVSHRIITDFGDAETTNPAHAETQLNVLASFNRVVDRMDGHTGSVPYLSWSPDGTRLASSGNDETARIWNFLPQSKKQRMNKKSCKLNYVSASLEIATKWGLAFR